MKFLASGMGIKQIAKEVAQYLFDGLSFNRDLIIFTVVSAIVILSSRLIFKKKSDQSISTEDDINQY